MRLVSLEVSGFRGFAEPQSFDLSSDVVVVVGPNGNGKTSIFDAILWALTGRVPRLGDDSALRCKFTGANEARVVLGLVAAGGSSLTVTRVFDGTSTRVTVETPEAIFLRGPQAEGRLIQALWPEAAVAANPSEALAALMTRTVYLQQDLVREFVDAASPQDRFNAVSELVGAGRVNELQVELERAKRAWSQATNARASDLQPFRARLSNMEARRAELRNRSTHDDELPPDDAWSQWWVRLHALGIRASAVPLASREAAVSIDTALKQLDAERAASERHKVLLAGLAAELAEQSSLNRPELAPLRDRLQLARQQVESVRAQVLAEQARAAEARRQQSELREQAEQMQALAALALKHLGEVCPVCNQEFDAASTRSRLEELAAGAGLPSNVADVPEALPELLEMLSAREQDVASSELALRAAEQLARDMEAKSAATAKRLAELKLQSVDPSEVSAALVELDRRLERLSSERATGESLALRLSRVADLGSIQELEREIEAARELIREEEKEVASREATGEEAQKVIEALRVASSRVVAERVKGIEPLLSEIYGRVDVHPAFRAVRFLTAVVRGRGQLSTVVGDDRTDVECDTPGTVLSSSQLNALAVCVFLSLNLGATLSPLDAIILDDPLQSLDDINLLGLIDLLRQTKEKRQLVVSTHDKRFGALLSRKLRPRTSEQRTVVVEVSGWNRKGPIVTTRDIRPDPAPLRLVKSVSA